MPLGVKGCFFHAEKSADPVPWKLQLTHLLKGRLCSWEAFVAPQDTATLPFCQGLFSTQISCPPARRADILALAACSTFQRSLWERLRRFAAVYSRGKAGSPAGVGMVVVQSRLVLLWPETFASVLWKDGLWMNICQQALCVFVLSFSLRSLRFAQKAQFPQRMSSSNNQNVTCSRKFWLVGTVHHVKLKHF